MSEYHLCSPEVAAIMERWEAQKAAEEDEYWRQRAAARAAQKAPVHDAASQRKAIAEALRRRIDPRVGYCTTALMGRLK